MLLYCEFPFCENPVSLRTGTTGRKVRPQKTQKMKRREFIKGSVAASTIAAVGLDELKTSAAERNNRGPREYYELRAYRLKSGASRESLDNYLEKAAIPALNRLGCKPVGAFVQAERSGAASGTEVRDPNTVLVLIPFASLEAFGGLPAALQADAEFHKAGEHYLHLPKDNPAFDRIESWLMLAFAGMPIIELPDYCREKKQRMFELRTYESHSELKAIKKVEMFNSGEIDVMRDVGLGPIFYGQALIGPGLPHLTYMLSAESEELHKQHFGAFSKHPTWGKLKNDPQYADTVSKIKNWFLAPTAYSQI
jgi:hypothetical protein